MTEIARVNREQAKNAPEAAFDKPSDVSEHEGLTRGEKLTVLRKWSFEVQRRLDSANEGMLPEPDAYDGAGAVTRDSDLMRDIELEIAKLVKETGKSAWDNS